MKYLRFFACSLMIAAAVILSACGGGGKSSKATAATAFSAQRGTEGSGGQIILNWELPHNFDYDKWTGDVAIWVSKIDGETTDIESMSDADKELYYQEFQTNYMLEYYYGGLPHGKTYTFSMKAKFGENSYGETLVSGGVELSLTVPSKCRVSYSDFIFYYDSGTPTVRAMWRAPSYNGGSPITGYQISTDSGENWENLSATTTQHYIRGVENLGTAMSNFRIRAVNAQGAGAIFGE
jgi:hypothetical protein